MKKTINKLKSTQQVRFAGVGAINTLLDFIILNSILKTLTINPDQRSRVIIVNCVSATIVSIASFYLNRRYVFKTSHSVKSRYFRLLAVSLVGIFVIQSGLIAVSLPLIRPVVELIHKIFTSAGVGDLLTQAFLTVNIAKCIGVAGSMVWNFTMYKRYVFYDKIPKSSS